MKKHLSFGVTCLFILFATPRLLSLEAHWSSDEARWLFRSAHFITAVKNGEFSETLVTHHPGVTTMWIAGLRKFFMAPHVDVDVPNLVQARWLIGVVVWAGIGVAFLLIYQLFGQWVAFASFAFLAYSPFFLAQTRRVHTDALATTFILLTVLLFLRYCQNRQRRRYLIFSGIAFGLAIISKSYALILLPWIPLCLFLFGEKSHNGTLWTCFAEGICFLNCAVLTGVILWPVFWTPTFAIMVTSLLGLTILLFREIKKERIWLVAIWAAFAGLLLVSHRAARTVWIVFEKANLAVTTPHAVEHFFLGKVVNDPGWLFYPFVLSIKSTPLMLPLALSGCLPALESTKTFSGGCLSVSYGTRPHYQCGAVHCLPLGDKQKVLPVSVTGISTLRDTLRHRVCRGTQMGLYSTAFSFCLHSNNTQKGIRSRCLPRFLFHSTPPRGSTPSLLRHLL